jgi:hypothetical protein
MHMSIFCEHLSGNRAAPRGQDGQTDGHDEANSRFSQFCEHALKEKGLMQTSKDAVWSRKLSKS